MIGGTSAGICDDCGTPFLRGCVRTIPERCGDCEWKRNALLKAGWKEGAELNTQKWQDPMFPNTFYEMEKAVELQSGRNVEGPFLALNAMLKVVASGSSAEEAKLKARAAGCSTPLIARNDQKK